MKNQRIVILELTRHATWSIRSYIEYGYKLEGNPLLYLLAQHTQTSGGGGVRGGRGWGQAVNETFSLLDNINTTAVYSSILYYHFSIPENASCARYAQYAFELQLILYCKYHSKFKKPRSI
jgi:hypothetical protein